MQSADKFQVKQVNRIQIISSSEMTLLLRHPKIKRINEQSFHKQNILNYQCVHNKN